MDDRKMDDRKIRETIFLSSIFLSAWSYRQSNRKKNMKGRFTWIRIAQCVVSLASAFTLKLYYSAASADQLRWILAPTTALVELLSGATFEFESHAGYISRERGFLIANSCSGVNFLITAFLMLSMKKLLSDRSKNISWRFIPTAAVIAYLTTLVANTARIVIALRLRQMP